jgi:hypothetical protein
VSDPETARRADYVLRALAASEIAESAPTAELRKWFLDLTAQWLWAAQGPEAAANELSEGDG